MRAAIELILRAVPVTILLLMTGCAGVRHGGNVDLPAPRVVAVLPITGALSAADGALVREMLHHRLETRAVRVVDNDWVDRRLVQSGLMSDARNFDASKLDPANVCRALRVDGYVTGSEFSETRLDLLLYFRRSFRGRLDWWHENSERRWWAKYSRARSGGLLIHSGQVFKAVRETSERGAPGEFVRNAEAWLDEVLATLPEWTRSLDDLARLPGRDGPSLTGFDVEAAADGRSVVVHAVASPDADVRFDLSEARGVPMVEIDRGQYRGTFVRVPGNPTARPPVLEALHVRDRFGKEVRRDS